MKTSFIISEILNSGDLYGVEDKINELRYSIEACEEYSNSKEQNIVAKMQYELAVLEDVRLRILKKIKIFSAHL